MARRKPRKLERVATLNLKVGRGWRAAVKSIRELIDDEDPDVIALQEAMYYAAAIVLRFGLRWRITAAPSSIPEGRNVLLLVRRSVPSRGSRRRGGWGWVRMRIGWTGPKQGKRHPGRTWPWRIVDEVLIVALHRVTGGPEGGNRAAYAEEAAALVELARDHDGPVLIIGDTNTAARDRRPGTMRDVAEKIGGRVIHELRPGHGVGVDYAVARGVRGRYLRGKHYGSDHRSGVLHLTTRGDTLRESMS